MANIKSAKKRARQSLVRKAQNQQLKKSVRQLEKKLRQTISAKDGNAALGLIRDYESAMSKAARKGKYHPKTASRKISRLHLFMNRVLG